jgi:hypothetical protein
MAKIYQEAITILISKLIKDGQEITSIVDNEILQSLESVAQELIGSDVVIEVAKN